MNIEVSMLAFDDGRIRVVEVPEDEIRPEHLQLDFPVHLAGMMDHLNPEGLLDLVFKYGQNDFQPKPYPSVSAGDVICLPTDGSLWIVRPVGFRRLSVAEFEQYKQIPRRDRAWSEYARPAEE